MAIFWKHIKGTSSNNLWTWINWSTAVIPSALKPNATLLPEITIANINDRTQAISLGQIVTTNATDQIIMKRMDFKDGISINALYGGSQSLDFYAHAYRVCSENNSSEWLSISQDIMKIGANQLLLTNTSASNKDISSLNTFIQIQKTAEEESINSKGIWLHAGDFTVSRKVEALYFNATSDRRAKDNIQLVNQSALNLVNKWPVYTFNYKTDPTKRTIGVMAQDLANVVIDGASLVDNINATGKDGDYMSIKESKLVYVLLKAIQEQQDEIKALEKRIEQLEGK